MARVVSPRGAAAPKETTTSADRSPFSSVGSPRLGSPRTTRLLINRARVTESSASMDFLVKFHRCAKLLHVPAQNFVPTIVQNFNPQLPPLL